MRLQPGSPGSRWGAYSTPPDLLAGFKWSGGEVKGKGRGREREEIGRKGGEERGEEVNSDAQLEQGR